MLPTTETRNHLASEAQKYLQTNDLSLGIIVLVFQRELTPKIEYVANVNNVTAVAVMQQVIQDRLADERTKDVN